MQSGRLEWEQWHFVSHFWLSLVLLSFSTELSAPTALSYHFQDFWFSGRVAIPLKDSRIYATSLERTTENCCLPQCNLLPGLFSLPIFLWGVWLVGKQSWLTCIDCIISAEYQDSPRLWHCSQWNSRLFWMACISPAINSPLAFSACLFPFAHLVT